MSDSKWGGKEEKGVKIRKYESKHIKKTVK